MNATTLTAEKKTAPKKTATTAAVKKPAAPAKKAAAPVKPAVAKKPATAPVKKEAAVKQPVAAAKKVAAKPAKAPASLKQASVVKSKVKATKLKLVKVPLTLLEEEKSVLKTIKADIEKAGASFKKNELIRAAVLHLKSLNVAELTKTLQSLPSLKKDKKSK